MELKVEAKNLEMRDNWQEKIEEEKAKLIPTMHCSPP